MDLKSGYPYWLIKDGLQYSYPKLENSFKTEVAIIGGGISGAFVAYYLINAGISCAVLDGRSIGLGSTCASTSLLLYEIDVSLSELQHKVSYKNAARSYQLCGESIQKLSEICKKIGFKEFQFKNCLYYAANKKDIAFLKDECEIRAANNFKVNYLDRDEIKAQYGFEAPGAILSDLAGQTNAYGLTHALHQHSIKKGCKVYERTFIKKIEHSTAGVKLKADKNIIITAKKLVYANGYEAVNYINKKIVDLHSTYATVNEHKNNGESFWKDDVLIWNTDKPYLYMRTTPDGRIIVGGRDEKFYDPQRRDKLIEQKSEELKKDFKKIFPGIEFNPEFNWAGTFGATKDGLPYIGTYKPLPNSYFALGFGGNGITFSLIAAEIISDLISGKKNADATIFGFDRI
ncbi:MAG: FAD-binding oxidoreductase [Chitinophagaceae bacterium]|nr:FAD-binding oxidoreductase [Chitinophagaceae bacterium]